MADPEIPAPKLKLKRSTPTFVDPEEMAEMIVDELEKSREGIDKKLAKYNDSILQAQIKKRQLFIDYCESEIGALPKRLRSSLATKLLSSEEFAVKMNFSELHTSSAKSHLTWSCGDASLSDPSWRNLLQQYSEGTAEASATRTREVGKRSQATRKGSSPPVRASLPIAKPARPSTSTAQAEDEEDPFAVPDDHDPLSIPCVTISKTRRKTSTGPEVAPPSQEAGPRKGPRGTVGRATPSKTRNPNYWTEEEMDSLKLLCAGQPEACKTAESPFWYRVQAQMPGRSVQACRAKWVSRMPEAKLNYAPRKRGRPAGKTKRKLWSREELELLEQVCPRPGKPINWERIRAYFPDRTISSIKNRLRHRFGPSQMWSEGHLSGLPPTAAADVSGESMDGDTAKRDDEDETETGWNGGSL